ncbi:MAG: hypothetical protein FJ148_03830 [Deltaproteobacteria bacterium]|nr:hypothetical protein [Deltaproteobacteria bacterium]
MVSFIGVGQQQESARIDMTSRDNSAGARAQEPISESADSRMFGARPPETTFTHRLEEQAQRASARSAA